MAYQNAGNTVHFNNGYYTGTGNMLPEIEVVNHKPQYYTWGKAVDRMYGGRANSPLADNFFSWADNIGQGIKGLNDFLSKGTFIPGTAMSFVTETKTGRWLSMGGIEFSAARYSKQKALIEEAKWAGKYIKGTGNAIGYGGLLLTGADMVVNGVNTSNSLDFAMGIISFVPGWGWIAGGIYFIGNATLEATTGKNLGQHIDDLKQD